MMIDSIRAEFRKLRTIRSTYVIMLFVLALLGLAEFYAAGFRGAVTEAPLHPEQLMTEVFQAVNFTALLVAIVPMLLVTHEYRYNTITYTLTGAKRRTQVFFAKAFVVTCFALLATALIAVTAPLLMKLGYAAGGGAMPEQVMYYKELAWRCLFFGWGFSMMSFVMAMIIRAQVGAIVALFFVPGTVEGLLGLVIKDKVDYLPFNSLNNVIQQYADFGHPKAALVFLIDLAIIGAISLFLFVKRDAN
jgi:ABC-2 type transport system permease protein